MKKAFTLVELLIVIVIIGILAVIAIQQYQKMVWRARCAEIYNIIGAIAKAEQLYYTEHGHYTQADFKNCLAGNGIPAGSTKVQKDLCIDIPDSAFCQYLIYPSNDYPNVYSVYFKQRPYNWAWLYNYHTRVWQRAFANSGPLWDYFVPPLEATISPINQ